MPNITLTYYEVPENTDVVFNWDKVHTVWIIKVMILRLLKLERQQIVCSKRDSILSISSLQSNISNLTVKHYVFYRQKCIIGIASFQKNRFFISYFSLIGMQCLLDHAFLFVFVIPLYIFTLIGRKRMKTASKRKKKHRRWRRHIPSISNWRPNYAQTSQ